MWETIEFNGKAYIYESTFLLSGNQKMSIADEL